jgi:hypothetical protein
MLGQVVATGLSLDSFTTDSAVLTHNGQVKHRLRQDLVDDESIKNKKKRPWSLALRIQ